MNSKVYGGSKVGEETTISKNVIVGYPGKDESEILEKGNFDDVSGATIGDNCTLRAYGIIYSEARLEDNVITGNYYMVREGTIVGRGSLIGSQVVIEDDCKIRNDVSLQTGVYVPTSTSIKEKSFLGPNVCLTNDKYPDLVDEKMKGPTIKELATIGANSTILPKVKVGKGALVGAASVVTKDVEPFSIVRGNPAEKVGNVKEKLRELKNQGKELKNRSREILEL